MRMTGLAMAAVLGAVMGVAPVAMWAQTTGVSHPDNGPILADEQDQTLKPAKPSAAVPVVPAATTPAAAGTSPVVYGAYVPYTGPKTADAVQQGPMTEEQADGAVVLSVPEVAGALRTGTLLRTRLTERLSTGSTAEGARFSATLTEPVEKDGRVVLPIGTLVEGTVTQVWSGKRITGGAGIHLEAQSVVLPNGTRYQGRFRLIDTDLDGHTRVNNEGTLKRRGDAKETLGALGLGTGGGAAAGAVIGGGVGAAVGAGIGAGVGTIIWLKQERQEVVPAQTTLVWSLSEPMPIVPQTSVARDEAGRRPLGNPDGLVVGAQQ